MTNSRIYQLKKQQQKINLSPKFVWLEAEDFDDARAIIKDNLSQLSEESQWQIYLKALGQIGFEKYVKERNPSIKIKQDNSINLINDVSFLWINDFRLCLIIVDNLVDDFIIVPKKFITSAEIAAHFYVLLEVLEEEEKLNIYGFLRYDELFKYSQDSQSVDFKSQPNENFQLPLSLVDTELNNLLLYTRFLEPSAITLFALEDYRLKNRRGAESAEERGKERLIILDSNNTVLETLSEVKSQVDKVLVNLSKWWDDIFEEGWQSTSLVGIKVLNNPMWGYVRNNENSHKFSISRTKFFDFGLLLQNQTLALIINLQQEENGEQSVLVQVLPHQAEYLPPGLNLKITLNPNSIDSISQEVSARQTDNLIQLEFTEESNKEFKIEVSYQDTVFTQEFIL
ncbi:MAG: DUF1822 family protein [Rivularia sp. T60_A2020_040]|nr:DUF1822 family protein [Rivularia sp. T60_A2020_040]